MGKGGRCAWGGARARGRGATPVHPHSPTHPYPPTPHTQSPDVEDWSGVGAVLCGHKEMAQAVTEFLTARGVPKERILLNF